MFESRRILIVDNDRQSLQVISAALEKEGFEAVATNNAETAIELFKQQSFPVVVTDIGLDCIDGISLLHYIKSLNDNTQVVLTTDHALLYTAVLAFREGAYDYLVKPFEVNELVPVIVKRAYEKNRLISQNAALIDELRTYNLELLLADNKNKTLIQQLKQKNDELERANGLLHKMAFRDGLTGLFNYRCFRENLSKEVARSQRYHQTFSLIFIDIDHFKKYNDLNGHPAGDTLLMKVGEILNRLIRTSDLACRYGGEEFVILLPSTPKDGAVILADRIKAAVESHRFDGSTKMPEKKVTASIGIATFPEDGATDEIILEAADQALYNSKKNGRNTVSVAKTAPCTFTEN